MMEHHPSSPTEFSAVDTVGAIVHASQTTPSRTEAAKEEDPLKSLVDVLQQVMRGMPTQGTPAQHSAVTPTLDTIDALWLKVYRKHAKKQKNPRKRRNDKKTCSIYNTVSFDAPN